MVSKSKPRVRNSVRLILSLGLFSFLSGCTSLRPNWSNPTILESKQLRVVTNSENSEITQLALAEYRSFLEYVAKTEFAALAKDPNRCTMYIFSSSKEFRQFLEQQGLSDKIRAFYYTNDSAVFAPSLGPYARKVSRQPFWSTLRHELVHHLQWSRTGRSSPFWLGEGLAEWLTYNNTPSQDYLLTAMRDPNRKQLSLKKTIVDLKKLIRFQKTHTKKEYLSRWQAYLLVRSIMEHPKLKDKLVRYTLYTAESNDGVQDLCKALGVSLEELAVVYQAGAKNAMKAMGHDPWVLEYFQLNAEYLATQTRYLEVLLRSGKSKSSAANETLDPLLKKLEQIQFRLATLKQQRNPGRRLKRKQEQR